jgi:hypothetical protein
MDRLGLSILVRELQEDAAVMAGAVALARQRLAAGFPGSLEACGYELNRTYNILEKSFERICVAFENHFDKRGDYHERLIERLSVDIPGIRPAFLPPTERAAVRDLKGFRHVFRHAYELSLLSHRLEELVRRAEHLSTRFPEWVNAFRAGCEGLLHEVVE